jgi:hypothetical protein
MGPQELRYVKHAQAPERNLPALQPLPKVLNGQDVKPYPSRGVSARVQIRREAAENYAKVVGGHTPTNQGALEEPPDQGEIHKTLVFHRLRQLSSYPNPRPNTKRKSVRRDHGERTFA